eukprot:7470816-Lingulodinium_polyedra.AAC.1
MTGAKFKGDSEHPGTLESIWRDYVVPRVPHERCVAGLRPRGGALAGWVGAGCENGASALRAAIRLERPRRETHC